MANLIVLLGTTGVGKSTVSDVFEKKGYQGISLDRIIKRMYPKKDNNNLSEEEIIAAYKKLGDEVEESLKNDKDVVVDEWFYLDNSFDYFFSRIKSPHKHHIFYFHLVADLEEVVKRNEKKPKPLPEDSVREQYRLTLHSPGMYYRKLHPVEVRTDRLTPSEIVDNLLSQVLFKHKMVIEDQLKGY
ncbi:MAG: AAA family ATPase [Nanoarchaeota archaeon]